MVLERAMDGRGRFRYRLHSPRRRVREEKGSERKENKEKGREEGIEVVEFDRSTLIPFNRYP